MKKTPLYDLQKASGAKMIDFGGWLLPVSYSTPLNEHHHVRNACGIFDVSHMGEIFISGSGALAYLDSILINDPKKLGIGHGQYSALTNEKGGIVDDLIIYRIGQNDYLACVNASNVDKDHAWFTKTVANVPNVTVRNESHLWGQLAAQGPKSDLAIQALFTTLKCEIPRLNYMEIAQFETGHGVKGFIARTGYTGEKGYELYIQNVGLELVWKTLTNSASPAGSRPVGLGARDTLRLEACYLLYGQDMDDSVSPLEAGIEWATKLKDRRFTASEILLSEQAKGPSRRLIAFKMLEDGIPRHGMVLQSKSGEKIGEVTSGSVLPTVGGAGGMALVSAANCAVGTEIFVEIRGKLKLAQIAKKPLYSARVKG
jgi:aminomethyltransferase